MARSQTILVVGLISVVSLLVLVAAAQVAVERGGSLFLFLSMILALLTLTVGVLWSSRAAESPGKRLFREELESLSMSMPKLQEQAAIWAKTESLAESIEILRDPAAGVGERFEALGRVDARLEEVGKGLLDDFDRFLGWVGIVGEVLRVSLDGCWEFRRKFLGISSPVIGIGHGRRSYTIDPVELVYMAAIDQEFRLSEFVQRQAQELRD